MISPPPFFTARGVCGSLPRLWPPPSSPFLVLFYWGIAARNPVCLFPSSSFPPENVRSFSSPLLPVPFPVPCQPHIREESERTKLRTTTTTTTTWIFGQPKREAAEEQKSQNGQSEHGEHTQYRKRETKGGRKVQAGITGDRGDTRKSTRVRKGRSGTGLCACRRIPTSVTSKGGNEDGKDGGLCAVLCSRGSHSPAARAGPVGPARPSSSGERGLNAAEGD